MADSKLAPTEGFDFSDAVRRVAHDVLARRGWIRPSIAGDCSDDRSLLRLDEVDLRPIGDIEDPELNLARARFCCLKNLFEPGNLRGR